MSTPTPILDITQDSGLNYLKTAAVATVQERQERGLPTGNVIFNTVTEIRNVYIKQTVNNPGGANGTIQFNNATGFSGDPEFKYNATTNQLEVDGSIVVGNIYADNFIFANNTSIVDALGGGGGNGAPGASAYTIAVTNGFSGTTQQWLASLRGTNGNNGTPGQGVPVGGTTGQILAKINGTDYNTEWVNISTSNASTSGNSISDGTSNVTVTTTNGNVVIGVNNDAMHWKFATDGNIYSKPDTDLRLIVSDTTGNGNAVQQIVSSGISELAKTSLDEYKFTIYTDMQGAGMGDEWSFKGSTLEVITSSTIRAFGANIVTESMYDGSGGTASLRSINGVGYPNILSTFDATPTGANIKVFNDANRGGYTWQFDNNGNLNVPFNGAIKAGNLKIYPAMSGFTTSMVQEFGNLDIRTSTGVLTVGWNSGIPNVTGNITSAIVFGEPQNIGNAIIRTGNTDATTYNWVFGDDGNLTLPGNTFAVNYADGTQVSIGGSGATNEITSTDPGGPTYSVSVGTDGVVSMTTARGGLEFGALPEPGGPTHFHIMRPMGENGSGGTDLYFGDDFNYVLQRPDAYGGNPAYGVEIGANDNNGGAQQVWRFGTDGDLVLPAGKTIRDTEGVDLLAEATNPQYGYFNEIINPADGNRVNGEAVAMDSGGNSYVSYSYYDDNDSKNYGGVNKFDNTGEKLWSIDIIPTNINADGVEICSLEYITTPSSALLAFGSYYDNVTSKDVAFMYTINPDSGAVGVNLAPGGVDADYTAAYGMELKDGVVGVDSASTVFGVIVGRTYDQKLTKTFTPLNGSTTNKVYLSWTEVNASELSPGAELTTNIDGFNRSFYLNRSDDTIASPDGTGLGLSVQVSAIEGGTYNIIRVTGWNDLSSWTVPQSLRVLGSSLGGVDGVNDFTFDFDRTVFNNNGDNINAAVSNKAGTPVSNVYCSAQYSGYDWSTQIGNTLTVEHNLNNQAFIARFGFNSWSKNLGQNNSDVINSVVVDSTGNTYVAGYVDNGSRASLVVKYNITGDEQWAVYIDPINNTRRELTSIDLLSSGDIITVDEDGTITKLDKDDGSILWQVTIDDNIDWNNNFRGTATPEGDYIITNDESNDYTMYVMRVSGADGSGMWTKRITHTYLGNNGEIYPESGFDAQYIDCNDTYLTIGATVSPYSGNNVGLVFSFPIDGLNIDGTHGKYVISTESMSWTTETTTALAATVFTTPAAINVNIGAPTKSDVTFTITQTTIGGTPVSPYISISALKTLVAASTDFADFQSRIASL